MKVNAHSGPGDLPLGSSMCYENHAFASSPSVNQEPYVVSALTLNLS